MVICDRHPSDTLGAIDGPRLPPVPHAAGIRERLYHAFARAEHRLYRTLPSPDVLIKLTVSLETAKSRNRSRRKADKHTDHELEDRHLQPAEFRSRIAAREIDTQRPLTETLLTAKRAIWETL